tara:strand:+ start:308 stop:733 length:426 start_codon:yes stop_codon:yes gene_type:complete
MTLNNKQPSKKKGNVILNPKKEDLMQEKLDPVGREDSDIDNDGKKNTKSDRYLLNRRKVRGKVIKMREEALDELKRRRSVPKGEGAVDNEPEEVDEAAACAPEKSKVDDKESKEKSKERMKQKMMQMTRDFDDARMGKRTK